MPDTTDTTASAEAASPDMLADLIHQAADVREELNSAMKSDQGMDSETRFECRRAVAVIGKLAARLMTEINTPPALPEGLRETLVAALNAELGDSYDCGRVWEAWEVGTMSEDDFTPIADRVDEIADGLIAALGKAGA